MWLLGSSVYGLVLEIMYPEYATVWQKSGINSAKQKNNWNKMHQKTYFYNKLIGYR